VATQTSEFLIELFQASDPREKNPEGLRARDLLDRAAEPLLVSALEWRQAQGQLDHDLADSWNNVGLLQSDLGWSERAEASLRRSIAMHRQVGGESSTRAASPLHNLAIALRDLERHTEAREAALQSLALKRSTEWSLSSIAVTLAVLANIERSLGNLDAARTRSEKSLALREQVFGRDSVRIASGLVTHARILAALDDIAGAEAHFLEAMNLHEQAGSQQSLASANVKLAFGRFLHEQGHLAEADEMLARSLTIAGQHLPPDAPQLDRYRYPLGSP
jgi:serine/threonine-protein kinase